MLHLRKEEANASSFYFAFCCISRLSLRLTIKLMGQSTTIWVNEQLDPAGLLYACIACCDQHHAQACHESFEQNLTDTQKAAGWIARLRTVESWDDVPACALKLS